MCDTESIGSLCPACGFTRCLIKYTPGGGSWFTYQACPRCGLAYGENGLKPEYEAEEVWEAIEDHFEMTRKQLYEKYKDFPDDECDLRGESLFIYNDGGRYIEEFREKGFVDYGREDELRMLIRGCVDNV